MGWQMCYSHKSCTPYINEWMNERIESNWHRIFPMWTHHQRHHLYVCLPQPACSPACLFVCVCMCTRVHSVCECLCVLRDLFNVSRTSSNYFLFYILHSYHGIVHRYKCYQLSDRAFTLYSASNLHSSAHSNNLKRAMISSTLMLSPISTNLNAFVAFLHKCILLTIS